MHFSTAVSGSILFNYSADISSIGNNTLLCIVDYYSKFPIMKADGLSTDDLIRAA